MLDRTEHVESCKKRAREYLDQGDVANAIASILSDMPKHSECGVNPMLAAFGIMIAQRNDVREARRFIEGFN